MIQSKWPFSHRDLDSGILIYHQTEFHLVVVLIHLWLRLCSIIAPRHLHTSLNARLIVFYFILIPSVDSLFFLSSSEHIRASASLNKAQPAFIAHMHFHYMVFIRLQRAGDQKEQRGLDVQGTRPGNWRPSDSGTMTKIQKADLFAYAASKHSCFSSLKSRDLGLIIQQVLSDYIFIRCNVRGLKDQVN